MKKKLLIEVGDDIDLDFLRNNCKTGGPIVDPVPECRAIADGKVLSGMTNGDVIRAMFPLVSIATDGTYVHVEMRTEEIKACAGFYASWWNAPYKEAEE